VVQRNGKRGLGDNPRKLKEEREQKGASIAATEAKGKRVLKKLLLGGEKKQVGPSLQLERSKEERRDELSVLLERCTFVGRSDDKT